MMKIAVIYYSETGHTEEMARLIAQGINEVPGMEAMLMPVSEISESSLDQACGFIVGSPTQNGSMCWQMKKFFREVRSEKLRDKLGAVFATGEAQGGGSELTELTMIVAMLIKGMLIYSGGCSHGEPATHLGAVATETPKGLDADKCVKLGRNVATMASRLFGEKIG